MSQTNPSLTSFKALSFDCYGTLINWIPINTEDIRRLIVSKLPASHPYVSDPFQAVKRFTLIAQAAERAHGEMRKNDNMAYAIKALAEELGLTLDDDERAVDEFSRSTGTWPPYEDTVEGLQRLQRHYKLIILSNIDDKSISDTLTRQLAPVEFDAVYTAQQIGEYKPHLKTFRYLAEGARRDLGVDAERGELLHVACSMYADHVPCKQLGWPSVWIWREGSKKGDGLAEYGDRVAPGWKFETLGEFADEVDRAFGDGVNS